MLWDLLAAVVAGLLVTQLATAVTTVYLHRALAHRALTMHPGGRVPVPVRDLDHHRDAAARVGRGAPQAPRRDRHRARTRTARSSSGSGGCSSATSASTSGSPSDDENTRKYARDIPADRLDRLAFDYSLVGLERRDRHPRGRDVRCSASRCGSGSSPPASTRSCYVMLSGAINAIGHRARQAAVHELGDERSAARAR